jgi:hypothetical protein
MESSAGAKKELYAHFYHPDFEVVARNFPEHQIQELKRILVAFTSSLEIERRALSRIMDAGIAAAT